MEHGLNGLNGFYGSLGCGGSIQALVGETIGSLSTNNKTLLSFRKRRHAGSSLELPVMRAGESSACYFSGLVVKTRTNPPLASPNDASRRADGMEPNG